MAAIGTIRSWGPWLVGIIALGLFGFIAGDMWRSCEATSNQRRQQIGEVLGNKLYIQDYQQMIDEYQEVLKIQGNDNLSEDQLNSLKDYVWDNFVQNKLVEAEADKLGLTVTDDEVANVLKEGTNPVLYQLPLLPQFMNQQTRQFDYNQVTYLYNAMRQQMDTNPQVAEQYRTFDMYWKYIEKTLRQQLLTQKYQNLMAACLISNPVSAKMAFDNQNTESDVLLASLAYNSVNDNDIEVSDADMKAKYNEMKKMFKQDNEVRDIKYVAYQVVPSDKDRVTIRRN
jgi:peptidyl-prolyl cis-trans isomerase D